VAGDRLVHGVVDDFGEQVVQRLARTSVPPIYMPGRPAHRLQPLQHLDVGGGIRFRRDCLTNNEIRRGLRRAGFEDIRIGSSSGRWVRVVAEWSDNGRDYSMRVHRCTGEVTDIRRIRRGGGSPGFGFQFEFDF
jgi:hypothetical protein